MLHPADARRNNPLYFSAASHQPAAWSTFFANLHILVLLLPYALHLLLVRTPSSESLLLAVFTLGALYVTAAAWQG